MSFYLKCGRFIFCKESLSTIFLKTLSVSFYLIAKMKTGRCTFRSIHNWRADIFFQDLDLYKSESLTYILFLFTLFVNFPVLLDIYSHPFFFYFFSLFSIFTNNAFKLRFFLMSNTTVKSSSLNHEPLASEIDDNGIDESNPVPSITRGFLCR